MQDLNLQIWKPIKPFLKRPFDETLATSEPVSSPISPNHSWSSLQVDLETAKNHNIFCYVIRQAYQRLEPSMNHVQKLKFNETFEPFFQEELEEAAF